MRALSCGCCLFPFFLFKTKGFGMGPMSEGLTQTAFDCQLSILVLLVLLLDHLVLGTRDLYVSCISGIGVLCLPLIQYICYCLVSSSLRLCSSLWHCDSFRKVGGLVVLAFFSGALIEISMVFTQILTYSIFLRILLYCFPYFGLELLVLSLF